MAVYFVYRCHYAGPTEKHIRRFESDSVLDWFRGIWQPIEDEDEADKYAEKLLGMDVYSFGQLFVHIAEEEEPPPRTESELRDLLEQCLYVNEMVHRPHAFQIYTDDDELEMAIYIFDDHYLAKNAARAAFVLHEDWRLPGGAGKGGFQTKERTTALRSGKRKGTGTTYLAFLAFYDSGNLMDLEGGWRLEGVRLPDLARHLAIQQPDDTWNWPSEVHELRELLLVLDRSTKGHERAFLKCLREAPADEATWNAYSDWLQEQGELPVGPYLLRRALERAKALVEYAPSVKRKRTRDLVHVEEHLAQACLHAGDKEFHQWILFDDLWASAHPDMADGLLRFARRWDVL